MQAKEIQEEQRALLDDILKRQAEEKDPERLQELQEQQNILVQQMHTFQASGFQYEGGIPQVQGQMWIQGQPMDTGQQIWTQGQPMNTGQQVWTQGQPMNTGQQIWTQGQPVNPGQQMWTHGQPINTGQQTWTHGQPMNSSQQMWTQGQPMDTGQKLSKPPDQMHSKI